MSYQPSLFDDQDVNRDKQGEDVASHRGIVNVASVPMRSPFRYAGGKTWLVPTIRRWLRARGGPNRELVEVFAGGGIITLTAVFEGLVERATMVELDEDVAAVWQVILGGQAEWLAQQIMAFELTRENAHKAIEQADLSLRHRAFATIVKNRVNRGGILAPGASFVKHGENGKGIRSRWYPKTLKRRILDIAYFADRISFIHGDAFVVLRERRADPGAIWFIDPPYVQAGRRLYRYSDIDHAALFAHAAQLTGDFLMTYDDAPEIVALSREYGFDLREVPMKSSHHARKVELVIGRDLTWFDDVH